MIKRTSKATALLVAATSVISSVSPAMANTKTDSSTNAATTSAISSESPAISKERLDAKEGSITNAVAFKDGKYLYEGYKDQNDTGLYYNDGTGASEKLLDNVSDIDTDPKFGDDYVSASNGSNEYKINLADGTVSDEDTKDDLESIAKSKLKNKLINTDRYSSKTEIKSFNRVSDGQFEDDWYSYTATGNSAKYDDILGVPKNLAAGLTFTDEDATVGKISGTVSITKAADEQDIDSYRVYYLDKNDEKVGSAIGTVDKTESTLQVAIADTDIPSGATQLGVYSINSKGESETATKIALVDAGATVVTYKSQIKIVVNAFYSDIVIDGKTFSPAWGSNLPDALASSVKNATFDGYTVVSAVAEHKVNSDGSIDNNNGKVTIVLGSEDEVDSLPDNFATFGGSVTKWAVDAELDSGSTTGASSTTSTNAGTSATTSSAVSTDTSTSSTTTTGAAVSTDTGASSTTTTGAAVSADTSAKTRITVKVTNLWGDISIAGVKFSPNWGSNLYTSLASDIKAASFSGYTLESATSDGTSTTAIFTTTEELSSVPSGFTTGLDWSSGYGTVTIEPITTSTSTTTGAAASVGTTASGVVSTESINSPTETIVQNLNGDVYAAATTNDDVVYYGYTDENGNYIDCSKIANISVYDGKDVIRINNFNDEATKNGKTVKLGLPTLVETLGQDKDYIYTLISVPVIGYQLVNGNPYNDTAKTTVYYVQKISKIASGKQDGAYLPSKVESYQLNNEAGWTGGDNWSYMAAYNMLVGNDSSRKIKIVDGKIFVAHNDDNGKQVTFGNLKLSKTKWITPVSSKVTSSKVNIPIVYEDFASNTDMNTWTMDSKGNVWAIDDGEIKKSAQGNEFQDIYSCDKAIDNLDVYDDDNLIGWSSSKDVYITAKEGEMGTTGAAVIKTGWHKLEDGTWHLYDVSGKEVKGWTMSGSGWYYMNDKGVMQTGWINDNGKWYYLADSGLMKTGWINVDEKWYYLDQSGARQENTTIDGYSLDSNGVWIQ